MRITYDPEADAAYIRLSEVPVSRTEELDEGPILDLDAEGRLRGIELLSARTHAKEELLILQRHGWLIELEVRDLVPAVNRRMGVE